MKKFLLIPIIIILALILIFNYHKLKQISHVAPSTPSSNQIILPTNIKRVANAIEDKFFANGKTNTSKIDGFTQYPFYLDPISVLDKDFTSNTGEVSDWQQYYGQRDENLTKYYQLPAEKRQDDYYLHSHNEYYPSSNYLPSWNSEYYYNGKPAPFAASFIIHLESVDENQTKIEVIEIYPRIYLGKRIEVRGGHALLPFPGIYNDTRFVEPTTQESQEIIKTISTLVNS